MDTIIRKRPAALVVAALGALLLPGCATSRPPEAGAGAGDARGSLEILRSDFNASKIRTLNAVMKLTAPEAERFWPVYRSYEKDLASVGDRKLALVLEFMDHHRKGTLTDPLAQEMAKKWLRNVQDRLDLWKDYHGRISAALSPTRAAQFLQVENQLAILADLAIASEMPLAGGPVSGGSTAHGR